MSRETWLHRLLPRHKDAALQIEFPDFHRASNLPAQRWGMVFAIVLWCMAWCLGMWLRPQHADRLAMGLACVVPLYAGIAYALDLPRFRRHTQWMLALCNLTSGLLVIDFARFLPIPDLVRVVGMLMVTYYAVLGLRLRPVFALPMMVLYNGIYLTVLHGEQGFNEVFSVHAFLLGMSMVGVGSAAFILERNMLALHRQHRLMERQRIRLAEEHGRNEAFLRHSLPVAIADRLKNGPDRVAERIESATILFAEIADFAAFSDRCHPGEVVELLGALYTRFDELVQRRGLVKVRTIGATYMVAAGLPIRHTDHARAMAELALTMQEVVKGISPIQGYLPELRIGMHTGPVVAGVIGRDRMVYDVLGDTVQTARQLQQAARPGAILMSDTTAMLVGQHFEVREEGALQIKGKGVLEAFDLIGARTPLAQLRIA